MNEPEALAIASDIHKLLLSAIKMIGRDMEQRLAQQNMSISGLQFGVIKLLEHHNGSALNEISRMMMLAPATLVPAVDALEKNGFVTRIRDSQDRRRTLLTLTSKGHEALVEVHKLNRSAALVSSVREMGPDACTQLIILLRQLVIHAAHHSGAEDFLATVQQYAPLKTILPEDNLPSEPNSDPVAGCPPNRNHPSQANE